MTTIQLLQIILTTALLSSICTGILFYFFGKRIYEKKADDLLNSAAKKIGKEVEEGVIRGVEKKLPELQVRVKAGMVEGITEVTSISPDVKNAVNIISSGIKESLGLFDIFGQGRKNPTEK